MKDPGLSLFEGSATPEHSEPSEATGRRSGLGETAPLPDRLRPRTLDELVGQDHLVGEEGILRRLLDAGSLPSLVLHGPPGSGKTTLARLLAGRLDATFVPFSAVSEGVPKLRKIVEQARGRLPRRTLLFVDEIHRLNRGQQDFLLPFVESGLLTLIGATTEHPAFEINPALLSRTRVVVLESLGATDLGILVRRALGDDERGLGGRRLVLEPEAEDVLIRGAAGDARQALIALETAAGLAGDNGIVTPTLVREAYQQRTAQYDTSTAYAMLSAFHKSLRSSSGSGALYWAMRMIRGGEDPLVLFRRLIAAAYEDVGLADPRVGIVATQAMQAFERLGAPEGYLPLANAILYVATAPKSNRAYQALNAAMRAAEQVPDAPVPLNLRNATTGLMRDWGYGEGHMYAHDYEDAQVDMQCLPDELADVEFYEPTDRGFEKQIAEAREARLSRKNRE